MEQPPEKKQRIDQRTQTPEESCGAIAMEQPPEKKRKQTPENQSSEKTIHKEVAEPLEDPPKKRAPVEEDKVSAVLRGMSAAEFDRFEETQISLDLLPDEDEQAPEID